MKWVALALAACFLPVAAQEPSPRLPPPSIFGIYGPASKTRRTGRDSIRVTARAQGKVNLALKLYYANGHTCQLDKQGEWQGDRLLVIADGLDPNQSCKLEASFAPGRIHLSDEGQRCAQVYCGTRGKLDGVVMSKTRR